MVVARPRRVPAPLSVTQLAALVRSALDQEIGQVLVAGEISNLHAAGSGHVYFTLKDDRSQLRCAMFRSAAQLLVFRPVDGQEVDRPRAREPLRRARRPAALRRHDGAAGARALCSSPSSS